MQTASDLVTRNYRNELWEIAVGHMEKALNDHFVFCFISCFLPLLQGYGFQVSRLYRVLQNFRDQYNEILMSKCCAQFDELLATDNYTPIVVTNEDDLRCLEERFPLARKIEEMEGSGGGIDSADISSEGGFPRSFPFSELAPSVYEHVKEFIRGCFKFIDNLGMSQTDIDENIRRTTNVLLERFSGHLKRYLIDELKTTSLAQLVQITINMGYLGKSCDLLDLYIRKVTGRIRRICREIEGRHVQAQYHWEISCCDGRPSGYITDLIRFLHTTFIAFTNLPVVLARHICVQLCKYIASRLFMFLTDPEIRQISIGALEQINLDVVQCEQFAAQCPVPGFEDGTLVMTFADLRQVRMIPCVMMLI
ncbi:unnamed protein product [Soboliphyme baturini]|uniref:Exocyst complex component 6 n=1 Tax=Soboliphyme baturini TaxID=241478 RepID=A0A183J833_9BILA|nr:unnamed protein product [Soboliphyme baturini]